MIEDKIAQSEYFATKIQECQDKKYENSPQKLLELSSLYSGYLSASASVWDYMLTNANKHFKLGLDEDGNWTINQFEQKARDTKNLGAIGFTEWFRSRKNLEKGLLIGAIFSECRRLDVHTRPAYEIGFNPKIIDVTDPKNILMDPNIYLIPTGMKFGEGDGLMNIGQACQTHLSTLSNLKDDYQKKIDEIDKALFDGKLKIKDEQLAKKQLEEEIKKTENKITGLKQHKNDLEHSLAKMNN